MIKLSKKRLYKTVLFISLFISIICIFCLYLFSLPILIKAFTEYEGVLQGFLIISARILVLSIISYYLIHKWFQQETQYLSDIPFLLSLFFIILLFGKLIDLYGDLTFYLLDEIITLLYLKFRYIIIILEVTPLIFLGFEIIFFRLEERYSRLKERRYMNNLRVKLILVIFTIELLTVIIVPNSITLGLVLPFILIPSLIGIVYIFYLAYRLNRLSVVKPKVLTIGFFLYLLSNIFRPLMQNIIGENATYIFVVEFVDLIIFIVIFLGLYKKA